MSPVMRRPRRVVQKAFDGTAAINAYIVQRTIDAGFARMVETVQFLLDAKLCATDVHRMTGMPLENIQRIGAKAADAPRVGRMPCNVGKLFLHPQGHLRVSVFIGMLEKVTSVTGEDSISGESFAAALKATNVVCGSVGSEYVTPRHLVLAVVEAGNGTWGLTTCPACRVRYLRSRVMKRVQRGIFSQGECPYCRYVRQRSAALPRLTAVGAQESWFPAHRKLDVSSQKAGF